MQQHMDGKQGDCGDGEIEVEIAELMAVPAK